MVRLGLRGRQVKIAQIARVHGCFSRVKQSAKLPTDPQTIKKPSDLLGSDGNRVTLRAIQVTPTGVEPVLPP